MSTGAAIAATALLFISAAEAPAAGDGNCGKPVFTNAGMHREIQGSVLCAPVEENFRVYCDGIGTLVVGYITPGNPSDGNVLSPWACADTTGIWVKANAGNDMIDLSSVTAGSGFGITQQNILDGGFGNDVLTGSAFADNALGGTDDDVLLLRDGVDDVGNCGAGTDVFDADAGDTLIDCEIAGTSLPVATAAATTPVTTAPAATGPVKKCKRKRGKKRCKKKRR